MAEEAVLVLLVGLVRLEQLGGGVAERVRIDVLAARHKPLVPWHLRLRKWRRRCAVAPALAGRAESTDEKAV